MRKFTSLLVGLMALAPATTFADSWTKTVTSKSEFNDAWKSIGEGVAGETYTIICDWPADQVQNVGNLNKDNCAQHAGRIVIRSNQTDYAKMPAMTVAFDFSKDFGAEDHFSLIFENMNLQYRAGKGATSGQIVYQNQKAKLYGDTIAFRNCDINNFARTIFRSVPSGEDVGVLDWLEMTSCRVHDGNVLSGNNWYLLYPGSAVNHIKVENNIIYDLPYSQGVVLISKAGDTGVAATVEFNKNTVLNACSNPAEDGSNKGNRFVVINTGNNLGQAANYYINDNVFLAPKAGLQLAPEGYKEGGTTLLACEGGILSESNNVIDNTYYKGWVEGNSSEGTSKFAAELLGGMDGRPDLTPEEAGFTSWEAGQVFQDPEKSIYNMLKSHKAYTAGFDSYTDATGSPVSMPGTQLGAAELYIDAFPVKANVNININGGQFVTYTVAPEQPVYYVNDEITVSLNDHNSKYRTFNTFKGWSDGSTETTRTIKLTGDLDLTANYEATGNVISAFDFQGASGNNHNSYDANLYVDEAHKAVAYEMMPDTAGVGAGTVAAPFEMKSSKDNTELKFQMRANKFGEDAEEDQMGIMSRRTPAVAHQAGQVDYAVYEISTKGYNTVNFSCFVGTDNFGFKKQLAEYSLDGTTWTKFAEVELTAREANFAGVTGNLYGWAELKGALPAEAGNQDKIYVRVISDPTSEALINTAAGEIDTKIADTFEYIGNVLFSSDDATNGISTLEAKKLNPNAPVYTISGVRVSKTGLAKGIYIQNGKKFVVK